MSLIEHSLAWIRGELVEHAAVGAFGLSVLVLAGVFWRFGIVPHARALALPFVLVGAFFVVVAAAGLYSNSRRISSFQQSYAEDSAAFAMAETARTDGFLRWYPYTLGVASIAILVGLALFHSASGPSARGTSLALILFGIGGLLIDNVSEANGRTYRAALTTPEGDSGR